MERQWGRAATGAGCPFVLVDPDGRPGGTVGLRPGGEEVTLGYWVVASARGGGAAGAGLAAVADRALRERGVSRPVPHIEPWNTASVRVAERVGFRREGMREGWLRIGGERRDVLVFAPSRRDREAARRPPRRAVPTLRGRPGMTERPGCTRVISTSR